MEQLLTPRRVKRGAAHTQKELRRAADAQKLESSTHPKKSFVEQLTPEQRTPRISFFSGCEALFFLAVFLAAPRFKLFLGVELLYVFEALSGSGWLSKTSSH